MDFEQLFDIIYYELNVYYLQPNIFYNLRNIKKVCKKWNLFWIYDKIIRLDINIDKIIPNEKIFSLKNLNNIKYLNFNNNYVRDFFFCEQLLYLYCENTNISEIPETLNCLEELICHNCYNLIKIPGIKTLKKLDCSWTNISEIPETLNCLEELICYGCDNLIKIPEIKTLKILNCKFTNISKIPETLKCLEKLICIGCYNLEKIPETLNCLEELYCPFCKNLIKIPKIKTLKRLDCYGTNINEIPGELNYLEELFCNKNIKLPTTLLNLKKINGIIK